MQREKITAGFYRIHSKSIYHGIIRKEESKWYAKIHNSFSGRLVRYAGIWETLKDAQEEVEFILERSPLTF